MFKNVLKSLLFLLILAGILALLSYVFTPKNNTKEFGMPEVRANGILSEKENSIDVLIIGDSESYVSVSPMEIWQEYGYTSYVMGTNAQKIYQSYNYLLEALETQHPKVVILETNTFFRKLRTDLKVINFMERYIPIVRYHDRWKNLNSNDFGGKINYTGQNDLKGYYYINYNVPYKEAKPKYMWKKKDRFEMPKDEVYYIKKIYEKCKENNIALMFYTAPNVVNWWYAKHNTTQDLATELKINYLDTNLIDEIDIDWVTDTKDAGDHVNYKGAVKVSKYLGKYVGEKYKLVDHRGDPNYKSWDTCLENYLKILADGSIMKY